MLCSSVLMGSIRTCSMHTISSTAVRLPSIGVASMRRLWDGRATMSVRAMSLRIVALAGYGDSMGMRAKKSRAVRPGGVGEGWEAVSRRGASLGKQS